MQVTLLQLLCMLCSLQPIWGWGFGAAGPHRCLGCRTRFVLVFQSTGLSHLQQRAGARSVQDESGRCYLHCISSLMVLGAARARWEEPSPLAGEPVPGPCTQPAPWGGHRGCPQGCGDGSHVLCRASAPQHRSLPGAGKETEVAAASLGQPPQWALFPLYLPLLGGPSAPGTCGVTAAEGGGG